MYLNSFSFPPYLIPSNLPIVIESICRILGELTTGYKITVMFISLNFYDDDIVIAGKPISTKWKRLKDAIILECNNQQSAKSFPSN